MKLGDIGRQDAQYRRGVVLGLTIAEAMLLILFAMLLALGSLLFKRDRTIEALMHRVSEANHRLVEAEAKADVLQSMIERRPPDAFIKELVKAREGEALLDQQRRRLDERQKELDRDTELANALRGPGDKAKRVRELAAVGARLEAEVKKVSPDRDSIDAYSVIPSAVAAADSARRAGYSPEEAKAAFQRADKSARDNATLKGQVVRMREALATVGKGGDYPPCWVTAAGKIEFIFEIELLGNGVLRVRDTTPISRLADRKELTIPAELTAGTVSPGEFLRMTLPLYDASKTRNCRYFVTVMDRTGATQKDLFKRLLLTVEGRFYKVLRS